MDDTTSFVGLSILALVGCSQGASTDDVAGGSSANASATSAAKARGESTVTMKFARDECHFEFEAPEELKVTAEDGRSSTLESQFFQFVGYAGYPVGSEPTHPLDELEGSHVVLHAGVDSGIALKILKSPPPMPSASAGVAPDLDPTVPEPEVKPKAKRVPAINGWGTKPYAPGRWLGCAFNCSGVDAREADVIAMCKSVRVTVANDAPKKGE